MAILIRTLLLSILLASSASAATVFAPIGLTGEREERSLRFHLSAFVDGVLAQQGLVAKPVTVNYALDLETEELTVTPLEIFRPGALHLDNIDDDLTVLGSRGGIEKFKLELHRGFLNVIDRASVDLTPEWEEPATIGILEDLGNGTYVAHNIDGPWSNPNMMIFDQMIDGLHVEVRLDRYGYYPEDAVTFGVPEPSTLLILTGALLCLLSRRILAIRTWL